MGPVVLRILLLSLPALAAFAGAWVGGVPAAIAASVAVFLVHDLLRRTFLERVLGSGSQGTLRAWLDPVADARQAWDQAQDELTQLETREATRGDRLRALVRLLEFAPGDETLSGTLSAIRDFCVASGHGDGFALFTLGGGGREIFGEWVSSDFESGQWRLQKTRWSRSGVSGALAHALDTGRSNRARVDAAHLVAINGQRPAVVPDAPSRVFALASSSVATACFAEGWLHTERCPAYQPDPVATIRSCDVSKGEGRWARCATCADYPIHGVLVVFGAPGAEAVEDGTDVFEVLARVVTNALETASLKRRSGEADRLRSQILDALMNGVFSTDQRGRVVFANQAAREVLAPDEPVGRKLEDLIDLPGGSSAVSRVLIEGRAVLQANGLLQRSPRTDEPANVPVEVNLTPLRPESGGVKGAVCVIADRSQIRAMRDEIRHLDTLAAIGRFASSLAHEIRNPLGGIQAGVEFLARDDSLQVDHRESLGVIQGEVQRLEGILKNLLSVARPREMVVAPCDPIELSQRVLRSFRELADTVGVELKLRAPRSSEPLHGDREMIQQVLLNLVKNAIEATPSGGRVEVIVHPVDPADASRARARFEISDSGPGIAEEDLPHLFEPFFSRKSQGTGLGLYVCHGFVERHGGRLRAENRPEGGARFLLDLPRIPALLGGVHATSHSRRG